MPARIVAGVVAKQLVKKAVKKKAKKKLAKPLLDTGKPKGSGGFLEDAAKADRARARAANLRRKKMLEAKKKGTK